jgi:processive 1,2-diacylglycerol beta-glucosyltransferase
MVTKPGGLSISEALVSGLPMIFFSAIPGQETNNIRVLKDYGIGLSGQPVAQIALTLKQWQSDPAQLQAARDRIRALARPSAVADIISMIQ